MKCKICKSENAVVAEWHHRDARKARVECPDCGAEHFRPLTEWELINQREVQPQDFYEVLHDMRRIERYDEEMDRVYLFWRRYLFFIGTIVCGVLLWVALQ